MMLATSLLALALSVGPVPPVAHTSIVPCAAPTQTGIFRITATNKDSTDAKVGMILLERVDNCLEASIITESGGPALIDDLMIDHDVITGRVRVASGVARVTLKVSDKEVSGSIVDGKREWSVNGRRTTGM